MSEEFEIIKLDTKPEIKRTYRGKETLSFRMIESFIAAKTKWAAIKIPSGKRAGFISRGISRTLHQPRFRNKVRVVGHSNVKGEIYLENMDL